MATANPNSFPYQDTLAVTAYPAASAPQINGSAQIAAGRWTITHNSLTLSVYVSTDAGANDYVIIPPGSSWTSPHAHMPPRLWLKLSAAGSAVVTAQLTAHATEGP